MTSCGFKIRTRNRSRASEFRAAAPQQIARTRAQTGAFPDSARRGGAAAVAIGRRGHGVPVGKNIAPGIHADDDSLECTMSDGNPRTSLPLVLLSQGAPGRGEHEWLINLLNANRYTVLEAEGGASFRVRAAAAQPDLIVLTEGADGAGLDLARALRADGHIDPSTPILLILPRAVSRADRIATLAAGVWDLITPPYDAELLIQQIG